ncbi:LysR family transcriptional regulator [Herbaspirillum autotrophicum]|uniref:LysR family transcriptional regulator n=1 Tax=Herbaspirillum autotrophicum TaxID=180195 RepID=UPI00067C01BE|nr:LysR family transcriptional regulator [Herbaspirillum autotrophicum]
MTDYIEDPGWELYRSFLAVLQEGSLSAAARALGVTQPTIGRHIDALEAALGFALFTRSQHGFKPTEAALALGPHAENLALNAAALLRVASAHGGDGSAVRGTVRISASEVVGAEVLPPILTALRVAHPQLVIELVLSNRIDDLLLRQADIAIRMLRPTQEALVTRRAGNITLGLHAHRRYLQQHPAPQDMRELGQHALIGFDRETAFIRSFMQATGNLQRAAFALRTDSDLAQLAAIRAGFGIGICQVNLARRDPGLVHLLPQQFVMQLDTWVVMHEDLRGSPRCRITFDALADGLQAYIAGDAQSDAGRP